MKMSKLTAAYMAGLVDGEGYISICTYIRKDRDNQIYYKPEIKITLCDKQMIEWCKKSFGGYIYVCKRTNPKWSDSYTWSLDSDGKEQLLKYIHPYLRLKKEQCELVLERIRIGKHINLNSNISKIKGTNSWRAYVYIKGKQENLGCFDSEQKALNAFEEAVRKEKPNFVRRRSQDTTRIVEIYNRLRILNKTGPSLYAERLTETTP